MRNRIWALGAVTLLAIGPLGMASAFAVPAGATGPTGSGSSEAETQGSAQSRGYITRVPACPVRRGRDPPKWRFKVLGRVLRSIRWRRIVQPALSSKEARQSEHPARLTERTATAPASQQMT